MNWGAIGAVAAILGLFEAPLIAIGLLMWGWAKDIDRRLTRIEARSHERRHDDPVD